MRAWNHSIFTSSLALHVGLGVAVLGAVGCTTTSEPPHEGGESPPVSPPPFLVAPQCATTIDASSVFQSTTPLDVARFQLVGATEKAVLASSGTSLHRSVDGGASWSLVDAPELRGASVLALVAFGSEIFVSVQVSEGSASGLFRSTDDGATWTSAAGGGCSAPMYLTTDGTSLFAAENGAVYAWDPAGATWSALPVPSDGSVAFHILESNGAYLYASAIYTPGVYRLELGVPDAQWALVPDLPAWGYRAFAFDGVHGFAANAETIFESADAGATWQPASVLMNEIQDLLAVDGHVLMAAHDGLRTWSDGGASWQVIDEQPFYTPFSLATTGTHVFAAGQPLRRASATDLGADGWKALEVAADRIETLHATKRAVLSMSEGMLLRSTDGGETWSKVIIDDGASMPSNVVVANDTVFALRTSIDDSSVAVIASTDDGATFETRGVIPGETPWVTFLAAVEGGLVAGVSTGAGLHCEDVQDITTTLYVSRDGGATWAPDLNGFPITFTDCYDESFTPGITGVAEAGGVLFATSWWTGTYRSVDGGETWIVIDTPEAIGVVSSVTEVDGALVAVAAAGGVARSSDGGETWQPSGLSGISVSSLVRDDGLLLATVASNDPKDAGVYASSDEGKTWSRVDATFDARVTGVVVQGKRLFAGTLDESVWAAPLACTFE